MFLYVFQIWIVEILLIYYNEKGFNTFLTIIWVLANMNVNMQEVPAYFAFSDSHFEQDRYFCPVFINSWHNTEYEKTTIFEKDYPKVFNNLPNDTHSEKSFLMFKDKP